MKRKRGNQGQRKITDIDKKEGRDHIIIQQTLKPLPYHSSL
jgi:hypothetical protein